MSICGLYTSIIVIEKRPKNEEISQKVCLHFLNKKTGKNIRKNFFGK